MNTPNIREVFPKLAREWDERDRREAKQAEEIRQQCANALECIAVAIRHPKICRIDLEAAQLSILKALSVANLLDPKDAA